jgi:hypothetical protein
MRITLLVALALIWLVTLLYAGAGFGYRGSSSPSIGPGLGAAIAMIIALVGFVASAALAFVLWAHYGLRWPSIACAATLPVLAIAVIANKRRVR